MALNTLNTDAISFKKLSGKAHTQQGFAVSEEGISSNIQLSYSTVFANYIEPLPVTNSGLTALYSSNGKVQRVKFQVDLIPNTQIAVNRSQGYRLKLPADWNASGDLYPTFVAGDYLNASLGKLQIVPSLYGELKIDGSTEYDPILYQTNGSTVITKFDAINWYLDTYNGILFIQDPPAGYDISASRPGFVEAFLYVGDYIDDLLGQTMSGSTGTTASNVGTGEGIFKTKVGQDLRFKSLIGTNGIAVTGTSNNILISFTGTSGGGTITGATNGLSVNGANIKLGGTLTGSTKINTNFSSFIVGANDVNNGAAIFTDGTQVVLQNYLSGTGSSVIVNQNQISVDSGYVRSSYDVTGVTTSFDSGFTPITILDRYGIRYSADYSANFTPRSLVDKAYVTGLTSSLTQNIYNQKVVISANTVLSTLNFIVLVDSSVSGLTITLPSSPVDGQVYKIKDVADAFTNNVTINGNGKNIDGNSSVLINTQRGGVEICYDALINEWIILNFIF
jgi:hypothetical protein